MRAARALAAALALGALAGEARALTGPSLGGAPPGAAACSGCHPRQVKAGSAIPTIYGRPAADVIAALASFRSGERAATVMNRIAPGFSDSETRAIAAWLSEQR